MCAGAETLTEQSPGYRAIGIWNVTSLVVKEAELVREVERYWLDIVRLTSTHSLGSGTSLLERVLTLFQSGVCFDERWWTGIGILVSPSACCLCIAVEVVWASDKDSF